jgi:hypothetical protein
MALQVHQFNFPTGFDNSVQVGDLVYYVPIVGNAGGFDMSSTDQVTFFGQVYAIGSNYINVLYDDVGPAIPSTNHYMMFSKNPEVNVSRLTGSYMKVGLRNNSTESAELFSVGTEISENSK